MPRWPLNLRILRRRRDTVTSVDPGDIGAFVRSACNADADLLGLASQPHSGRYRYCYRPVVRLTPAANAQRDVVAPGCKVGS